MKIFLLSLVITLSFLTTNMPQSDKQKWQQLAGEVSLVLVAEIEEVKPSPGFWSGHIAAIQRVRYKSTKVLKGNLPSSKLEVEYYVVKNSALADKGQARLSPEIFKVGSQLVLFLEPDLKQEGAYFTVDRNRGAVKANADIVKSLSKLNREVRRGE